VGRASLFARDQPPGASAGANRGISMSESNSVRRTAIFLTGALFPHEFDELRAILKINDETGVAAACLEPLSERMIKLGYLEWDDAQLSVTVTESGRTAVNMHVKYQHGDGK
jgi:hypothetical protein